MFLDSNDTFGIKWIVNVGSDVQQAHLHADGRSPTGRAD